LNLKTSVVGSRFVLAHLGLLTCGKSVSSNEFDQIRRTPKPALPPIRRDILQQETTKDLASRPRAGDNIFCLPSRLTP
jgi:hypothetical protein